MPKTIHGVFIQCEKSIKKIIDKMNKEEKDIILKDIDDCRCILNPRKYKRVLGRIEEIQNKFLVEPTEFEK